MVTSEPSKDSVQLLKSIFITFEVFIATKGHCIGERKNRWLCSPEVVNKFFYTVFALLLLPFLSILMTRYKLKSV